MSEHPQPLPSKPGFVHRPHASWDAGYVGGMRIPVVETPRLYLTALDERHLEEWTRLQADPRIAEWLGGVPADVDPQRDREDAWRVMALFVGHWALRGYGQWALVEKAGGHLIGRAGLWNPEGWPGIEVGWMVDADRWGQGYATEAGLAAVDVAFDRLQLDELVSVTLPSNTASRRVMEKVGLTDTGTTVPVRGREHVLYRITREEWMADVRPDPRTQGPASA